MNLRWKIVLLISFFSCSAYADPSYNVSYRLISKNITSEMQGGTGTPLILNNDTIVVGSYDQFVYFMDFDGNIKNKFQTGNTIFASPILLQDGRVAVGSTDGYIYFFSQAGDFLNRYNAGEQIYSTVQETSGDLVIAGSFGIQFMSSQGVFKAKDKVDFIQGAPGILHDGTVAISSSQSYGSLYLFNPDGSLKSDIFPKVEDGFQTTPIELKDGTLVFGGNDGVIYFTLQNGTVKTKFTAIEADSHTGSNWISANALILPDQTVALGSQNGYFYILNPDGTLKSKTNLGIGWMNLGGAIGAAAVQMGDGTLVVGTVNGVVHFLDPNGNIKANVNLDGHGSNAPPVIEQSGKILVNTFSGLYELEIH